MINCSLVNHILTTMELMTEEEIKKNEPLCESVCKEFSERLRDEAYETEGSVLLACASIVFYRFVLTEDIKSGGFTSFKAGDITIKQSAALRLQNAENFRDSSLRGALNYLKDVDFVFRTVSV